MNFNTILNKHPNIKKALFVPKERIFNYIEKLNKNEKIKFVLECNKYCLKNYKKIFENKKVAIIGPSPSIRNNENGEYIEKNYDIIVRVNKQWKFDSKLEKYIGKRTDILYNCIDHDEDCGGVIDTNYLKRTGVKLIVDPLKLDYFNPRTRDNIFHSSYRLNNYVFFHLNNQHIINFGMVNKTLYEKWDKESDTRINTGMLCIIDILHYNAKEVYVKGFSFFKDGYLSSYRNVIFGNKCIEETSSNIVLDVMKRGGNHNQEKQWIYLKKLLENKEMKEKFKPDMILDKILKLKNFNDNLSFAKELNKLYHDNIINEYTFIIKTFNRYNDLVRLLNSIKKYYNGVKIIVFDDSIKKQNINNLFNYENLKIIDNYVNAGLSSGRNIMIENVETPYFLLLDDDFFLDDNCNLGVSYEITKKGFDIIGGEVYDVGPNSDKNNQPRDFMGTLEKKEDKLYLYKSQNKGYFNSYPLYDFVLNFFVGKTESFKNNKWNDTLKLGEHLDFFLRCHKSLKITYSNEFQIKHYQDKTSNTEYNKYRNTVYKYLKIFKENHNINDIITIKDNVQLKIPG